MSGTGTERNRAELRAEPSNGTRPPLRGGSVPFGEFRSLESSVESSVEEVATETITPVSILRGSRYGSLTRGALRDALWLGVPGLSRADAELLVGVYLESRIIVEGQDGLLRQ